MRPEASTMIRVVAARAQLKAGEALMLSASALDPDAPQALAGNDSFRQARKYHQFIEVFRELSSQPADTRFETAKLKPITQHHEPTRNPEAE